MTDDDQIRTRAQTSPTRGGPSSADAVTADINVLAEQFGEMARALQASDDTDAMLTELVASAVRLIPGVDEGSISVVTDRRTVASLHPSGDLPRQVDAVQDAVGQGPCLSAVYDQRTVRVDDMATERRWPLFAPRAAELGAGGMLSFQLWVDGDNLGALNLYSYRAGAFDDESGQVGLLFASHAAVAFAEARHIDQLTEAVQTRDLIGQAKGILMERYAITADQAFRVLTRVSQQRNSKLRLVAAQLAARGELAELAPKPVSGPVVSPELDVTRTTV